VSNALSVRALTKKFGAKTAVDALDLDIRAGELYALLGPNGAGKTTTLRMVTGLLKPDSGSIHVFDVDALADPIAAKRLLAWLPDEPALYDKLTAWEYLEFIAGLWGVGAQEAAPRAEELLKFLGLWDNRDERTEGFSRGMKQKTALAGALIHDPKLLMLDEPSAGLSPVLVDRVLLAAAKLREAGTAILLVEQLIEKALATADRVYALARGTIVLEARTDEADLPNRLEQAYFGQGAHAPLQS
jgi:ABC-2 type transport system ATP-binding protein